MLVMLVFEICIAMWSYHTLASAVKEGAIYASTKGQDCTYTGNTCQASIAQIVQRILAAGVGIDSTRLNLTFHSNASGSTDVPCNPAGSCSSNATLWPPASGGIPNLNYIEITASYPAPISIPALLWPGQSLSRMGTIQFSASSRQVIQF
jgi:Flp pilus assembly protein TadG